MKPVALWTLLVVFSTVSAYDVSRYSPFDIANLACSSAIMVSGTVCPKGKGRQRLLPLACVCKLEAGFGTFTDCLVKGYGHGIVSSFLKNCEEKGNVTMTKDQFWAKYESTQKLLTSPKDIDGFNKLQLVDVPLLLPTLLLHLYRDGYGVSLGNYNWSLYYGSGMLGYWAAVFLVAALVNWTRWLFPGITGVFSGRLSSLYRRYVSLSATVRKKKTSEQKLGFFDCLIPSRMETVIVVGWLILVTVSLGAQIKVVPGNPVYTNKWQAIARMVADRTGIIVCFTFPLLVLFAGRNNLLQWFTRWNFATFIMYHRWVSRIAVLLVIVHAITFSVSDIITGRYMVRMTRDFMIWGTVACISGGFILLQGMMFFRRRWYEIFLLIHITLAVLFIVGGWYHTDPMGYGNFLWAAIGVWVFDRAVRLGRLAVFGAPKATVSLMADETLKVVVPKPKYWKSIPGGHAFLHFVMPLCFWQSHPFTFTDSPLDSDSIVLYLKVKGGATHGVYRRLLNAPGKTAKIRVLVEGPYGEPSAARRYKNAVFVAGGNGIPGIYSECVDLAKRQTEKQSLKLVWVIREWKSLSWFYDELRQLNRTSIQTTIYVTQPDLNNEIGCFDKVLTEKQSVGMDDEKKKSFDEINKDVSSSITEPVSCHSLLASVREQLSHIEFVEGRPSMWDFVKEEIVSSDGSIAFVSCGHPLMVDDVRHAVVHNLDESKYRVDFFEQLQVWA